LILFFAKKQNQLAPSKKRFKATASRGLKALFYTILIVETAICVYCNLISAKRKKIVGKKYI